MIGCLPDATIFIINMKTRMVYLVGNVVVRSKKF